MGETDSDGRNRFRGPPCPGPTRGSATVTVPSRRTRGPGSLRLKADSDKSPSSSKVARQVYRCVPSDVPEPRTPLPGPGVHVRVSKSCPSPSIDSDRISLTGGPLPKMASPSEPAPSGPPQPGRPGPGPPSSRGLEAPQRSGAELNGRQAAAARSPPLPLGGHAGAVRRRLAYAAVPFLRGGAFLMMRRLSYAVAPF